LITRFDPKLPLANVLHKDQWPTVWAAVRSTVGEPHWPEQIPWPGLLRDGPKTVEDLVWTLVQTLPAPDPGEAPALDSRPSRSPRAGGRHRRNRRQGVQASPPVRPRHRHQLRTHW
jgi:hypothetical protein